jgi:hypothetical protein
LALDASHFLSGCSGIFRVALSSRLASTTKQRLGAFFSTKRVQLTRLCSSFPLLLICLPNASRDIAPIRSWQCADGYNISNCLLDVLRRLAGIQAANETSLFLRQPTCLNAEVSLPTSSGPVVSQTVQTTTHVASTVESSLVTWQVSCRAGSIFLFAPPRANSKGPLEYRISRLPGLVGVNN